MLEVQGHKGAKGVRVQRHKGVRVQGHKGCEGVRV